MRAWSTACVSFLLVLAAFVFVYGKGTSYLSNDPAACANCHIMHDTYASWRKSQHHHSATCNDCHVPRHPIFKWAVKGANGMHHSFAFTFQKPPSVLRAAALSKWVAQESCQNCHGALTSHSTLKLAGGRSCVECHRDVGHEHH